MGWFDRLGRELNKGIGAVGGWVGDIIGGAVESFSDPGFQLPTEGGLLRKFGGLIGEAGERLLLPHTVEPMTTTGVPLPPTVPGGFPGIPSPMPPPVGSSRAPVPSVPPGGGTMPTEIPFPWSTTGIAPHTTEPIVRLPGGGWGPDPSVPANIGIPPGTRLEDLGLRTTPFYRGGEPQMATPIALPGGALVGQILRQIPGAIGGAALGFQAGQGQSLALPYGGTVFRQVDQGLRFRSLVEFQNPITGRKAWYRNVGRPILFS